MTLRAAYPFASAGSIPRLMSSGWWVGLMIFGIAAYLPAFRGVFTFDDYGWILDNAGLSPQSFNFLQRRPVTLLTFAANLQVGGPHPVGFHVVNIALHLVNGALVYVLIGRTLPNETPAPALAAIGAALFLLHPAQTGAITYISGRPTALMTFFLLVSHLAASRAIHTRARRWWTVSLAAFVLAVGSKETAIIFPALWFAWLVTAHAIPARRALRLAAPHAVAALALVAAMLAHPGYRALIEEGLDAGSLAVTPAGQWERRLGLGLCFNDDQPRADSCVARRVESIAGLARFLLFPTSISIDPGRRDVHALDAFVILLMAGGSWAALRSGRGAIAAGMAWTLMAIFPTSLLFVRPDPVADRLLYWPMVGIALMVSGLLASLANRRVTTTFAYGALVALAVLTWQRNALYRSEIALWEDAVAKNANHARARFNLGYAYELQGERAKAQVQYRAAFELQPALHGAQRALLRTQSKQDGGA